MKRKAKVVLEITWDDEDGEDHPSIWWTETTNVKLLDFEDFDEEGNLIA